MNIGLLVPFRNPPQWRVPYPEFYQEQLDQIALAEQLGYDEVWLTEHHFAEDGYSPQLFPLAAAIAARTTRIRIGFFLMLMPLRHPIEVAESATAVDLLSNGRFDLGLGQGYARHEFDGFGISRSERAQRLEESIEAIRGMWTQDPFSYKGTHHQLSDIKLEPKPVQQPHPPIWIGAMAAKSVERTGRLGCHYLGLGDPELMAVYDNALRANGYDPADHYAAHLRWAHVAPTVDEAWDNAQNHLHYLLQVYARWLDTANFDTDYAADLGLPAPEELRHADSRLFGSPLIGTPDMVTEMIHELTRSVRTTHLVLGMHLPGIAPDKVRQSMGLFAQKVMPNLGGRRCRAPKGSPSSGT